MSKLRFTDGVEVDTSGPLGIMRLHDGLYVRGEGFLIPVATEAEAEDVIAEIKAGRIRNVALTLDEWRLVQRLVEVALTYKANYDRPTLVRAIGHLDHNALASIGAALDDQLPDGG